MSLNENKYDAIVVLGGSYIDENTLPEWVEKRLDAAILRDPYCKHFLLLSRGSPHKKAILNEKGQLISECQIMAKYMIERKIDPKKILLENWSLDTIGNAYTALTMHCVPRNLRNLLIITSDFHMPRSKSIFEKVFSLFPINIFDLEFLETESTLCVSKKEKKSLENWEITKNSLSNLCDLHEFIFEKHNAYMSIPYQGETYDKEDMKMYCI